MNGKSIVARRENRKAFYGATINFDDITQDSVANVVSTAVESSEALTQLDGVIATIGDNVNLASIIAPVIETLTQDGVALNADSIDSAFGILNSIASEIDLDSVNSVRGAEVVASVIATNIYTILSEELPFVGNISDMSKTTSGKYKVYSVVSKAEGTVGAFVDGEEITPVNAGGVMAFAIREEEMAYDGSVDTYTFNLKVAPSSSDNYKMLKGSNEIQFGETFVNDFEVSASEATAVRFAKVGGTSITVTFDYTAGTIEIKVTDGADQTADGTPLYFLGTLDTSKMLEITASVVSEIVGNDYVAFPVTINAKVSTLDLRDTMTNTGINLRANGLTTSILKIAEEQKALSVKFIHRLAKKSGTLVDIAGANETTVEGKYKRFILALAGTRGEIVTDSGITQKVAILGGSHLEKIVSALNGLASVGNANSNGFRKLGYIGDAPCYFDPKHDTTYPVTDGVQRVIVIGNPDDNSKKAVIKGVGLPIIPNKNINDLNGNDTTPFTGKLVASVNKDEKSRKLVKYIDVKL